MPLAPTSAFHLPDRLSKKSDPSLISADERHFALIAAALAESVADVSARLDEARAAPARSGERALERDLEIHRLTARLRLLRRFGIDSCLGRIVFDENEAPVYVGRLGLTDAEGRRLLVDWRAPAAEPYFAATLAHPMGLATRRRYRWVGGRVGDYWDEAFHPESFPPGAVKTNAPDAALDDQSAFIASLGASRSPRMRDVLATIQADQDAIIRAGSQGALIVDGGPGTGKTVVALHRAAYLIYADPRLAPGRGGVLFIGPHDAYLAYVDDVLPSLGEDSVQVRTLRDLVAEGAAASVEGDPAMASLKGSGHWQAAVERAVRLYEQPPTGETVVETPWRDIRIGPEEWAEAFEAHEPGTSHNDARDQVWDALVEIVGDRLGGVPLESVRSAVRHSDDLVREFDRAWPLLDPAGLVASLWSSAPFLRACAPWLAGDDVRMLQRDDPRAWTVSDLPILDAARDRIGDPAASDRRRRRDAALAAQRAQMELVIDDLIAADDSELRLMSMLRVEDAQHSLVDEGELPSDVVDPLAGPFAHIIVDEAQELTDAEWRMLLRRCPSRSFTIVGDRAQARHGFAESWEERLGRIGLGRAAVATLTVNYRTPEEVMSVAEPAIRAALPDANVPASVRSSGVAVTYGSARDVTATIADWLATHDEGIACVVGDPAFEPAPAWADRVRSLRPENVKGLEFDLVVLVDPDDFGEGIEGAVDRYVAMTRSTRQLVILQTRSPFVRPVLSPSGADATTPDG